MRNKRRSTEAKMSSPTPNPNPSLPHQPFKDILSRLPLKSLTRFQTLSKPFFSLINSPDFISDHLRRSNHRPLLLLRLYHNPSSSSFSLSLFDKISSTVKDIPLPFLPNLFCFPRIIGSCLGIICLDISPCYCSALMLWNVGIRKFRTLPRPLILDDHTPFWMVSIGFGFNLRVNDFKVVRIVYFNRKFDELPVVNVEVYSWKMGSWKVLDQSLIEDTLGFSCVINEGYKGVCVNGVLYWLGFGIGKLSGYKYLVSFDMDSEEFRKIKIPNLFSSLCVQVVSFKGSVALTSYNSLPTNWGNGTSIDHIGLWVPDELGNDWNKLHTFTLSYTFGVGSPLGVFNNSELIVKRLESNCIQLSIMDPETQAITRLPICPADYSCEVYSYVESLIPPFNAETEVAEEPHD